MADVNQQRTPERAEAREKARTRLAELDAEWTPERWDEARRALAERLNAA